MIDNLEWWKVPDIEALPSLQKKLQEIAPYNSFTKGKRDKNGKPIIFIGNKASITNHVAAHLAIWCKSELLEAEAMKLVEEYAQQA